MLKEQFITIILIATLMVCFVYSICKCKKERAINIYGNSYISYNELISKNEYISIKMDGIFIKYKDMEF